MPPNPRHLFVCHIFFFQWHGCSWAANGLRRSCQPTTSGATTPKPKVTVRGAPHHHRPLMWRHQAKVAAKFFHTDAALIAAAKPMRQTTSAQSIGPTIPISSHALYLQHHSEHAWDQSSPKLEGYSRADATMKAFWQLLTQFLDCYTAVPKPMCAHPAFKPVSSARSTNRTTCANASKAAMYDCNQADPDGKNHSGRVAASSAVETSAHSRRTLRYQQEPTNHRCQPFL